MADEENKIWALRKTNLVFLAIIVFLLGGATYYALNWRAERASSTYVGPVAAPSVTTSPTISWKEVKGESFSFRYPLSWQEKRAVTGDVLLFGPIDEDKVFLGVQKSAHINVGDTAERLANQALGKTESALTRKTMLVGGHSAVVQERKSGEGVRFEAYIEEIKTTIKFSGQEPKSSLGTKLVYLEAKTSESVSASREIFDQILGTFQFED